MKLLRALGTQEDWWSIWIGGLLLALVFGGVVTGVAGFAPWSALAGTIRDVPVSGLGVLFLLLGALTAAAVGTSGGSVARYVRAFPVLFLLSALAFLVAAHQTLRAWGLGYALWALVLGLLISNLGGTPDWLRPAVRTELFIKTGLVILGAEVILGNMVTLGLYGLIVAWGVTPIVLIAMFWFGRKWLALSPSFSIIVAAATSVCGVSAAIAAAAACRARREELTLAVGMTLIFTVVMMVGMPLLSQSLGFDPIVAGAWIGGTVDSTGAVVAAGQMLGDTAMQTAAVIKMIQNLLIGVLAFGIAIYWTSRIEPTSAGRPGIGEIWNRFPKFVLGFIGASIVVSALLVPLLGNTAVDAAVDVTGDFRGWFFCLGFLSIGLESDFRELGRQMARGRPLILYCTGQAFNLGLTLLVVWLVFSGVWFPIPEVR